jgi:PAS domain S-box-containing protein
MSQSLHVLIVEDSEDDTLLLLRELRRGGYDPSYERVENAEAMKAALARQSWDIILSDFTMPHFSAPAALSVLQESKLDLPFIIVSGTVGEDVAVAAMKAGAHDYLIKDKLARLTPSIERELREARVRREHRQAEAETRRRNRELALLNQVIAASAAGLEPGAVLQIACRELALAFETPQATAGLLNEQKTEMVVVAEYLATQPGPGQTEARSILNQTLPLAAFPALQFLLNHKTPLAIADARTDERVASGRQLILRRGTISLLILPLLIKGEVAGGLALETTEPHTFLTEEINLAWSVADQVAGALAHARLTQLHQRLSAAIEQAAESVIITDTEGAIIYVNPAFEAVSGYSPTEAIGRNPRFLKSAQQDAAVYKELWVTIKAGQVWRGRLVNKKKDGTLYTEEATISPVRDERGVIVNFVAVKRDVTRELQLEEQYYQAQKMESIGRLAGGVAHDFNNLLTSMIGHTWLALELLPPAEPARGDLKVVLQNAERAAGLTRQLLAFARRQVIEPRLLNLNELILNMDKMLRRLIGEDIELATAVAPDLGRVRADPGQVEQVLLNLAINARDAMPRGGKLTIETANVELDETYTHQHHGVEPGAYVMLAVSDTGIGMDAATQARIFEPFFTTKTQGQGTGLGLATVYGIVKQSGGDIWVYSEPGRGTTFTIYLPRLPETTPLPEAQPNPPAEMPAGTETVLLVEDEEAVRALARQVLELNGYTVLAASNGAEALRLSEQHREPIHLLVTDVVMPHMSGHELAERLAAQHPEMKVLYMSGYTDQAIGPHGVLEPGSFFLQKSFTPSTLVQTVREVLDTSEQS